MTCCKIISMTPVQESGGDAQSYRTYVMNCIEEERKGLDALDAEIQRRFLARGELAKNAALDFSLQMPFRDRMADKLSAIAGSWTYILVSTAIIAGWMAFNVTTIFSPAFDPYPFILLNLTLSCVAALHAPIIMMSQKRLENRDRERSERDAEVNRIAELAIARMYLMLDKLLRNNGPQQLELQLSQAVLLEKIYNQILTLKKSNT